MSLCEEIEIIPQVATERENLGKRCRLCFTRVAVNKGRKPKKVTYFAEVLKETLKIDLENDDSCIHSSFICENCRKDCSRITSKVNTTGDSIYRPQIELFQYESHNDNCRVCNAPTTVGIALLVEIKRQKKINLNKTIKEKYVIRSRYFAA